MKNELQTKSFTVSRTFNAPRELVWKVWTEREHLIKWFSSPGTTIGTANMDLRPGGTFHYSLKTPDGNEMWGKWTFKEIEPPEKIVLISSFSDKDGRITRHPLSPTWPLETLSTTTLTEEGGKTVMTLEWKPVNMSEEEYATFDAARAGMGQCWAGTFAQLEAYLESMTK